MWIHFLRVGMSLDEDLYCLYLEVFTSQEEPPPLPFLAIRNFNTALFNPMTLLKWSLFSKLSLRLKFVREKLLKIETLN